MNELKKAKIFKFCWSGIRESLLCENKKSNNKVSPQWVLNMEPLEPLPFRSDAILHVLDKNQ